MSEIIASTLQSKVRRYLLERIRSAEFKAGERIPTEQALEEMFGVSRITVRNAVSQLAAMGLLVRRPGRGTFVAEKKVEQGLSRLTGFVEDMDALGLEATARLISLQSVPAGVDIARHLRIQPTDTVAHIERVRLANGEPLSFDITYLPQDIWEKIAGSDLERHPIFELFEKTGVITIKEAEYVIESSVSFDNVSQYLNIRQGAPILQIERTTYDENDRPIDYEILHYRGDRVKYKMKLTR